MNSTTPSPWIIRALTALLACCFSCGSADASTNRIGGGISLAYGPPTQVIQRDSFDQGSPTSSVSSGVESVVGNENYIQTGRINARAGSGSVGISATTSYEMKLPRYTYPGNFETVQASGTATAVFTDVLITGPGSGNLFTRLRMHLSGVLSTGSVPSTNTDGSVGSASVSFGIYVNNNVVGWGNRTRSTANFGAPETSAAGLFDGFTGGVVVTPFFSVPLNTPVTVKLELSATAVSRLDNSQNGLSSASSQYYQSLSFATDQPVFDLPAGYFANSPDGGIKDNRYTPIPADPPVLSIQPMTDAVLLSWPGDYPTAFLESSPNIPGSWAGIPMEPALQGSRYVLKWTNDTGQAFFRLRVP